TVLGTKIQEQPSSTSTDTHVAFVRTFRMERAKQNLTAVIADAENAVASQTGSGVLLSSETNVVIAQLVGAPAGVELASKQNSRIVLNIPKGASGTFSVVIWSGAKDAPSKTSALAA